MFDFLRYRFIGATLSIAAILFFSVFYFYKGGLTYSVEFTGGTQVLLSSDKTISSKQILSFVDGTWPGAQAREFSGNQVLIRVKEFKGDTRGLADRVRQTVQDSLPENKINIESSETVGPGVGADLRWKSMRAVLIALFLMLLYIAWRFWSVAFAAGAVVALFHDVFIVLGMFMLLGREISINVIGALLVVLSYSINDTIVIFSRIRENIKKMRGASIYQIINASLNQTFKRTLLTSISTFLTVGAMFVLGGEVLRDLSLALLMGIFFGTYSSIYIASPIMMWLYKEEK